MQDLTFIADRLEEINHELPKFRSAGFLEESTKKLTGIISANTLHIDLYLHSNATPEVREWAGGLRKRTNSINGKYLISIKGEEEDNAKVFGDIVSAIAIIPFDKTANNSVTFFREKIKTEAKNYRLLLIINFSNIIRCKQFATGFDLNISSVSLKEIKGKNLDELLTTVVPKTDKLEKLKRISYLNSIKPFFGSLDEIFLTENRAVQTRKMVVSQNLTIAQEGEQAVYLEDLLKNLSQRIKRAKKKTIEDLSSKYNEFNKPGDGKFTKFKQEKSKSFQGKDFYFEPISEKSEYESVKVKKIFQDNLLNAIKDTLESEFLGDIQLLKTIIKDTLWSINTQLMAKGAQSIELTDIITPATPIPDEKKTIYNYAYIGEQFSASIIKKGSAEYINAIRENSKIIPLVFATVTGIITNILKRNYVSTFITIAPVLYIFFDLSSNISKRRKNEFDLLIKNAREAIASEIDRICNESSKEWLKNITVWTDEIEENINDEINKNIRLSNKKAKKLQYSERIQMDQIQQNVNALQSGIKNAEGIKDGLDKDFKQIVAETETGLSQNIIIINEKKESIAPKNNIIVWMISSAFFLIFIIGFIWYVHGDKNKKTISVAAATNEVKINPKNTARIDPVPIKNDNQVAADDNFNEKKYDAAKASSLALFENPHDQYIYAASVQHLGDTSIKGSSAEIFAKCAQAGDRDCQYETGMNAYKLASYDQALIWFRKSADQGNSKSECMLGNMYYSGGQGVERDPNEAFNWYLKSAEQKNEVAMYVLGLCYADGTGTARDNKKAEKCLNWVVVNAKNMENVKQALKRLRSLGD